MPRKSFHAARRLEKLCGFIVVLGRYPSFTCIRELDEPRTRETPFDTRRMTKESSLERRRDTRGDSAQVFAEDRMEEEPTLRDGSGAAKIRERRDEK